jgi:hypothetical protein
MLRKLAVTLALTLAVTHSVSGVPAKAAPLMMTSSVKSDATIGANDNLDAYTGAGGLLLPQTFTGAPSKRRQVASCLTCIWKYTLYCAQDASVVCGHAVTTCSPGSVRYRVRFGRVPGQLKTIGSVCWGNSKPATRHTIELQLQQSALREVPALRPGAVPHGSSLTGVPLIVWTGQPSVFTPSPMIITGFNIRITATPLWGWDWGDGTRLWTANPGSAAGQTGPTHRYRSSGKYDVTVQTIWSARYEIDGVGTYQMNDGPINQSASMTIHAVDSKTVLVRSR